jgi:hypothetical protein
MTIILQEGEVGIVLEFTITDGDIPLDLTGLAANGLKIFVTGQGSRILTVITAALGRADYTTVAGDWPQGRYDWQLEATYLTGRIVKTERGVLVVEPAVA